MFEDRTSVGFCLSLNWVILVKKFLIQDLPLMIDHWAISHLSANNMLSMIMIWPLLSHTEFLDLESSAQMAIIWAL